MRCWISWKACSIYRHGSTVNRWVMDNGSAVGVGRASLVTESTAVSLLQPLNSPMDKNEGDGEWRNSEKRLSSAEHVPVVSS